MAQYLDASADRDAQGGVGTGPVAAAEHATALVVNIDSAVTRALLFDIVEGAPRFVALGSSRSTVLPPYDDAAAGVAAALEQLESDTGRKLRDGERIAMPVRGNGDGVDATYVTGTPIPRVRAALISVGQSDLARTLAAAARRTATSLTTSLDALSDGQVALSPGAIRTWLRATRPSSVVLIYDGGSADDWTTALDAVADAARDVAIKQGIVVADDDHQQSAAVELGNTLDLSGIDPAEYDAREIAAALEAELRDEYLRRVSGASGMRLLSQAHFVDRTRAFQAVSTFLHRRTQRSVLAVSIADGSGIYGVIGDEPVSAVRPDLDVGLGARNLLTFAPELVARWLPQRASAEEITEWALNRALRPFTELETLSDRLIAAAFQREILTRLLADVGLEPGLPVNLLSAGPWFAQGDQALALLALLDGIQPNPPEGLVSLALDAEGLVPAVGAIATGDPVYAREVVEQDVLMPLGTCIVVNGSGTEGALAVRGVIKYGTGEERRFSVPFGSIQRLPLGETESATLTLEPDPDFAIGNRVPGSSVQLEGGQQVHGGDLGVVIDARGRPVVLPVDPELRMARLKTWIADLGGRVE
ncbi:MAG TPA: hypothetical protein VMU89_00870 [Thermomicrobiaceae bacterium]|nr:hypothetical protein [Thermomicrobiaceae bacterium]